MAKAAHIPGIEYDASATLGIRLVLAARFEEMCALRVKALDWRDPEGVHDMRVASRRLRGALRDFMPYLRKQRLATSLKEIKALADALGRVRDHDVAILALEKISKKAPPEIAPGIERFIEHRREQRELARNELAQMLSQAILGQLQSNFIAALNAAIKSPRKPKKTMRPTNIATYRELARSTILERLDELERLSESLYNPLKVKPIHKMRIAAKNLRYAVELFEQCWGKSINSFSDQVAGLQSSLGELHDCDVWIDNFGSMLSMSEKGSEKRRRPSYNPLKSAEVWLLTYFVKLRTKHFRNSLDRWSEWEKKQLSAKLRRKTRIPTSVRSSPPPEPDEQATAVLID